MCAIYNTLRVHAVVPFLIVVMVDVIVSLYLDIPKIYLHTKSERPR